MNENRQEGKWLGLFSFLCALYICPFMLGYAGWYSSGAYREFMFFVPFQQLFLIGPVIYFYAQSLLNKNFRLSKKHLIHFLPSALYLLYSLVVFITDKFLLEEFYFYADERDKDLSFWYQMTGLISMLFYLILSLRFYRDYRKRIVQEVSFADEVLFKWISHFMLAFCFILVLRVAFFLLNPEWGQFGNKYWYYLCFSFLMFYISLSGYFNLLKTSAADRSKAFTVAEEENNSKISNEKNGVIDIPNIDSWKEKIQTLVEEERIYTNANLTLAHVASELNTNRNLISTVINQGFNMNFNDFINLKRVEAVEEKIKNGEHQKNTLLAIALDSGFNSKATFNRAFKKHLLFTPKQYILNNNL